MGIEREAATALPNVMEASRRNRSRGPDRRTWQGSGSSSSPPPWRPSRRTFIGAATLTLIGAAAGINKFRSSNSNGGSPEAQQKTNPYLGWERYINRSLPRETVLAIGNDLAGNSEYPGFAEVGPLMVTANSNPRALSEITSPFVVQDLVGIRLIANMASQRGAIGRLTTSANIFSISVDVLNKTSQQTTEEIVFRPDGPVGFSVDIEGGFSFAPDAAKKLILVKEFSHLLLTPEHKRAVSSQVLEKFAVTPKTPALFSVEDIIYFTSIAKEGYQMPSLGDLFDNGTIDMDGAGYWYIMRAYGRMKSMGLFNSKDLEVLNSDDQAFEAARRRGLLIEQGKGEYIWRDGVTPFSPEWTVIGRAVLRGEYQKLNS